MRTLCIALTLVCVHAAHAAELLVPPSTAALPPTVNLQDNINNASQTVLGTSAYLTGSAGNGFVSYGPNTLTISGDLLGYTGPNYVSTLHLDHNFGATGMLGSRAGLDVSMIMRGTSSNTGNNSQYYVGIADLISCSYNDNGTSSSFANVAGSCVGFNPIADLGTGTNWYTLNGEEVDVRSTSGSSVAHTYGTLSVKSGTGARGIYDDAAVAFVNSNNSTWKTIFQFGKTDGTPSTASDTTLLACQSPVSTTTPCPIGSGIDLTNFSITTAAFASPGFSINGTGAVSMRGHVTNTGATPTVASCGGSPTLSGTSSDRHGTITPGSGASTCTVAFQSSYGAAPDCILTGWAANTVPFISSVSTSALVVGFGNAGKFTYSCEQ